MIDTRNAPRRKLRFDTIAELRSELARIEAEERAGRLTTTGNWTPGQIFGHLAKWIDFAYDGYPMTPPGWVRVLGRMMKPFILRMPMPAGVRIRGAPTGTFAHDPLPFVDGLAGLRAALERLESVAPTLPSPMFGRLSHDAWKRLHLNHAALHLGYLRLG